MAVGQTASADDHGGSASSATRVALPSETAGAIDPGGDTDWFRFEVPASGEVTAETTGSLDTVGTLYDAAGNELAANDDSANDDSAFGNLNFRIQRTLGAGIYYVGVESWGNDTGSYVLRLGFEASATATAGATRGHLRNFGDFDGDGKDDVLLRHENGRWHYYRMDGRRPVSGSGAAGLTPNTTVDVAGIGDFNGDGRDDVLVRRANGSWYYYPMDGRRSTSERGEAALTRNLAWQVAGIGDFDGDGKDDVLLRHENGRWHYYRMDGRRPVSGSGAAGLTPNTTVAVAGIGDFNGDGRDDVLVRRANGSWYYYPMNGRRSTSERGEAALTRNLAWQVAGIGDFDGDGKDDVLLRHENGRWHYYRMDGRRPVSGSGAAGLTPNTTVAVAGIGDFNGDGRADVLVRRANGTWYYYPMNGRRSTSGRGEAALTPNTAWSVAVPSAAEAPVDGLHIGTGARSPVQPLQSVSLAMRGATADADYDILLDLSGSGGFEADDTIEVVPVKTAGQLLFAAPLPETLAENNAARRFAVRVRERAGEADETLSNTLMLTLGETDVPAEFAGYPTVILDVVLKAVYEGLDDPLLTVEAGAIEPGRSVRTAMALGLSTAYSDAQAEALLGSLFGVSLEASGTGGLSRSPTIAPAARALNTTNNRTSASVRCEALAPDGLCNAYRQLFDCAGDAIAGFGSGSAGGDPLARCGQIVKDEVVGAWSDYGEKIRSFGSFLRRAAPRLARGLGVGSAPAQQILDRNAAARQVIGLSKTLRAASELTEDARETYESMRDASKALTEDTPELIGDAQRDAAAEGVDDDEREAFFNLLEEADYHQSDAAAIEELEPVYAGDADVVETLGAGAAGGGGSSGGATCGADYEEFSVDDKTSTCVWSSLVEWNCYAGSRHVSHPNLGGANACLYYSLDFFQPDGSCRENYAKVHFLGRDTCRWAELGADKAAWYTLEKEHGVESPQTPDVDADAPDESFQDCAECPAMVTVPAGTFTMGAPESEPWSVADERPQRTVSIPAFAASAHEVTFAEWDACVAAGGCAGYSPDDEGWGRGDRPVVNVSWDDAQLYVDWLSRSSGQSYRLLTESEWEYAARAGTATPFHTGGTITPQQANFNGRWDYPAGNYNGSGLYRGQTVPVGSFGPNGLGLYDMHGNVWEWVQDCYGGYAAAPSDGSAVEGGACARVLRGGSWSIIPWYLRSAFRYRYDSGIRGLNIGFRVARTL